MELVSNQQEIAFCCTCIEGSCNIEHSFLADVIFLQGCFLYLSKNLFNLKHLCRCLCKACVKSVNGINKTPGFPYIHKNYNIFNISGELLHL